jgi:hypothetical protein
MDEDARAEERFDLILGRMLELKPVSKTDISAKVKAYKESKAAAKAAYLAHKREQIKATREAKKSGKRTKAAPPAKHVD